MFQGKACATTEAGQPARNQNFIQPALPLPTQPSAIRMLFRIILPIHTPQYKYILIQLWKFSHPVSQKWKVWVSTFPQEFLNTFLVLTYLLPQSIHVFLFSGPPVLELFPSNSLSLSLWLNSALIIFTFQSVPTNWFWLSEVLSFFGGIDKVELFAQFLHL